MKKLFRILRNLMVFVGWTCVFIYLSDILFILIWNFDFLSTGSWAVVSDFWNQGGIIKSASDVILVISLWLLPILWYITLRFALKVNYTNIILFPLHILKSIKGNPKEERIIIRNIKSNSQRVEEIKTEINSIKAGKNQKTKDIRSDVQRKLFNDL